MSDVSVLLFDKPLHVPEKSLRLLDMERVAAAFEEFEARLRAKLRHLFADLHVLRILFADAEEHRYAAFRQLVPEGWLVARAEQAQRLGEISRGALLALRLDFAEKCVAFQGREKRLVVPELDESLEIALDLPRDALVAFPPRCPLLLRPQSRR